MMAITLTKHQVQVLLLGLEMLEAREIDAAASGERWRGMTKAQHAALISVRQKLEMAPEPPRRAGIRCLVTFR